MCSYPSILIPALRWLICEIRKISIFFKASIIAWLGMDGHTLDIINLFNELISLRVGIIWSLILICLVICIELFKICLLDKKMQKRLLYICETNLKFLGRTIFPITRKYSILGMSSIELKTIACSLLGFFSIDVAVAKCLTLSVLMFDVVMKICVICA
jgi:hypothetical protein